MGFLQSPDPARKLARQYGIRGLFSPELVPSLQPVVVLDDISGNQLTDSPVRIGSATGFEAAVVGERATFRLEAPTGVIARVSQVWTNGGAAINMNVFFGSSITAPSTTSANAYTDGRLRLAGENPQVQLSHDTQVAALAAIHTIIPVTTTISSDAIYNVNWVFGNTTSFDFIEIVAATVNTAVNMAFAWEEFDAKVVR